MTRFITKIFLFFAFMSSTVLYSQNSISPNDLKVISGDWEGSLTYIDYTSNQPYTMPANVSIESGKNEYQVKLAITYPNEPKANSKDKISISKDGALINKNKVVTREVLTNQDVEITTEYEGKDNRKDALIRNIYIIGPNTFIIRKEVKFENSKEWMMRNEYKFTR